MPDSLCRMVFSWKKKQERKASSKRDYSYKSNHKLIFYGNVKGIAEFVKKSAQV